MNPTNRRTFFKAVAASGIAASTTAPSTLGAPQSRLHIACNQFCWINMYRREGKDFAANLDAGLARVKQSGMDGIEAILADVAAAERLIPLLQKHGLAMRSLYTSATLHDPAARDASIDRVVATAKRSKELIDLRIVVVNPTPLPGQPKSDQQLRAQAESMTRLGGELSNLGVTLAYHFHAPAWQDDGREFHHLMTQTDPGLVMLCLDTHWVYRGSGNNEQRVYQVIKRYGTRVAELHLRQSVNGVWTECMTDGDIDYRRVADDLQSHRPQPLLVLEQAVEKGTPNTLDAVESHRRSREYVETVFAAYAT